MKSKNQQAVELAEYIHQQALEEDELFKLKAIAANKATQADGESGMVFHTRNLLNLLKEIQANDGKC